MAEQPQQPAPSPDPRARIIQRCPNCEARADVSTFIAGALVRCSRCGVRFEVARPVAPEVRRKTPAPPIKPPAPAVVAAPAAARPAAPAGPVAGPKATAAPVPSPQWPLPEGAPGPSPEWPKVSAPHWDAIGLHDRKTTPEDAAALEHARAVDAAWQEPAAAVSTQQQPAAPAPAPAAPVVNAAAGQGAKPVPAAAAVAAAAANQYRAPAPATAAARPAAPQPPLPSIEGFAVAERIGQGGMGEVFRCTQRKDGRPVAVKVLSQSLAVVPDYVKRFEREAAAMAQLDHPGVVRLLDRGRTGPHCWISMELIDGVSLRTHAHQARPSARALAKLLAQVAHALAYAHARGVVHRDLKPDNVLVQPDGRTKVLDFGLAGLYVAGAECLTQSNVAMGTANYMAPEQRKDAKHVDHRADLYSFGVMTYELLTGELPVGRFPPPSKVIPGLDKSWDSLVERCLDLDPSKRPHSALELAHLLEGMSGVSPPMEIAPRTKRRAGRSRIWSWIGLGTGVAVLLGVASLRVAADHGRRPPTHLANAQGAAVAAPAGRAVPASRTRR
jgi:serine/threonine-protein kinase